MPVTTRYGETPFSCDELRLLHGVEGMGPAIRHEEALEHLLYDILAVEDAEAHAAGKKIRPDQTLQSMQARIERLLRLLADERFAGHALDLIERRYAREAGETRRLEPARGRRRGRRIA